MTIVVASQTWEMSPAQIAKDYELGLEHVQEALAFYRTHRKEIETSLIEELQIESAHAQSAAPP